MYRGLPDSTPLIGKHNADYIISLDKPEKQNPPERVHVMNDSLSEIQLIWIKFEGGRNLFA